ncbi:uncharacterized protein LOC123499925 [Portunus trituberculatus]|uniref:uncharacterized protein LOC123499925 n=1 Tax=Portunus trituberculatus TaxID=210409 RepID=UPI001E1CDF56|nr:uncharacterized protein LOC123499925 [Portunus trituberculatus]
MVDPTVDSRGVVFTGGGPATPTLDAITQFIYDILGEGNVTFQGITTGLDTSLESVKVLVVDRLEEVDCAGAPTTTSLPCLPLPDAEGPPQDSFVMEALEEESEVPPPKKRQASVWDQPEEEDEVTLQKKKLKLDIECLERKHKNCYDYVAGFLRIQTYFTMEGVEVTFEKANTPLHQTPSPLIGYVSVAKACKGSLSLLEGDILLACGSS